MKERFSEALTHYETLEKMEPVEPRWPHRKGDLLKRLGRLEEAICSYERAVDLYAQQGFVARAAAMAKVVVGIDPNREDVLERVTPDAARELHRSTRGPHMRRISAEALPLVADPNAEDALRFTRPPPSSSHLDLDISAFEVQDRVAAGADAPAEQLTAEQLAQLPSMPLFAEVPSDVLARLVKESDLIELEAGGKLIERGTPADALYTLIEGSVQLIRPQDEDALMLSEGDIVGISCLLERVDYEGDVTARTRVRALRISKSLLDQLVEDDPALADVLLEVLGRRLVATLVRTSPMFSSFDPEARSQVAGMFGVRRAGMGTAILEAGKRADGLYIPMIGKLTAVGPTGEEVGSLKLGRALGQHSMLTGEPSTLTVRADSDVLVLRLSARRFNELVARYPKMAAHLEELARHPSSPAFSLIPEARHKRGA
jgi:CRP-like cAMP-binding protein